METDTHSGRYLTTATSRLAWWFLPVYSSYADLITVPHGRMPCQIS